MVWHCSLHRGQECGVVSWETCAPARREHAEREGVALVLSGPAIAAQKTGGEQWKTWGSRIVRAMLSAGKRFSGQLHVLSCYAPTYAASREAKEEFYNNLQLALDEIPAEDTYVHHPR